MHLHGAPPERLPLVASPLPTSDVISYSPSMTFSRAFPLATSPSGQMAEDPEKRVTVSAGSGAKAVKVKPGDGTFEDFQRFLTLPNEHASKAGMIEALAGTLLVPPDALAAVSELRLCKTGWDVYSVLFPLSKSYFRALSSLPPPAAEGRRRLDLQGSRVVSSGDLRGCNIPNLGGGKKAVTLCRCYNSPVETGSEVSYWKNGSSGVATAYFLEWSDNCYAPLSSIKPGEVQAVYFSGVVNPDSVFEEERVTRRAQMPLSFTVRPKDERDRPEFNEAMTLLSDLGTQVGVAGGDVVIRVGGEVEMENLVWEIKNIYCKFEVVEGGERVVYKESVGSFEGEKGGYGWSGKGPQVSQEGVKAVWEPVDKAREEGWEVWGGRCKAKWDRVEASVAVYPRRELWDGVEKYEEYESRREVDMNSFLEEACICAEDDNENWLGLRRGVAVDAPVLEAVKGGWREAMR